MHMAKFPIILLLGVWAFFVVPALARTRDVAVQKQSQDSPDIQWATTTSSDLLNSLIAREGVRLVISAVPNLPRPRTVQEADAQIAQLRNLIIETQTKTDRLAALLTRRRDRFPDGNGGHGLNPEALAAPADAQRKNNVEALKSIQIKQNSHYETLQKAAKKIGQLERTRRMLVRVNAVGPPRRSERLQGQ